MMRQISSIVSALALLASCRLAVPRLSAQERQADQGQQAADKTTAGVPKTASTAPETTSWLDISIEHRTRFETLDNRFRLGEVGSDQQIPQRTRIRLGIKKVIGPVGFLTEFEDARVHLDDSASTVTNTHVNENDILQLYLSVALRSGKSTLPSMLYVGRQSFDLGSRRLFARNRFRNATNAFDGIRWTLGNEKRWLLNTFLFQPVRRRMHQLDTRDHGAYFWGAFLANNRSPKFKTELYYFGIRESLTAAQSQKRRFSTVGTRLYKDPKAGAVSYELETASQFGERGALDHMAHFEHVSADYTFNARWRPMVTGRYDYAGGDGNPSDNTDGTFDTLFGARRWELGPTGIYTAWYRSNLSSPGWALELNPTKKFMFSPAMRWMWLAEARDQWVGSKLRDVTGKSGAFVGSQLELRLRYNFTRHFRPEMGYVRFFKGAYLERVPKSPGSKDSNYFFVEANFIFDHLLK